MHRLGFCVFLALVLTGLPAWGQNNTPPADPSNPLAMWDVEKMVDRAVGQVVKRYKLNPEQEQFTRTLMTRRVDAFFDQYEADIRDMLAQAMRYQLSGQQLPPEKVQEWTARIDPMFLEARRSIYEGNKEFREVLTEDQLKIHDVDMRVMEQNFRDAEKRLGRWREGGFDPVKDLGQKPEGQQGKPKPPRGPRKPAQPAPGQVAEPVAEAPAPEVAAAPTPAPGTTPPARPRRPRVPLRGPTGRTPVARVDTWDIYVQRFIADYGLDQSQATQSQAILADCKKRAVEYQASHRSDYDRLQAAMAGAAKDSDAHKQFEQLNKPIDDLFNEMKARLDQIPTEAQRKAYDLAKASRGGDKQAANTPSQTQPARGPTASRPAPVAPRPQPAARAPQAPRPAASQPAARR